MIWIEDGSAVMPEVRGLLHATAAAIVNSREDWLQRKSTVRLVAQPKQGSWFALAAPVGIFQRKHRGRWRWA